MSFILDALKKSESDRQRQSGPALFEVKVAPPRARFPVWAIAIGALLVINMIIVGWMLLRRPAHTAETAAANSPPVPASTAQVNTAPPPTYNNPPSAPPVNQQGGGGQSRLPERDQSEPTLAGNVRDPANNGGFSDQRDGNRDLGPGRDLNARGGDPGRGNGAANGGRGADSDVGANRAAANIRDTNTPDFNGAANAGGARESSAPPPDPSANPDDFAPASDPSSSLFKGHVRRGTESGLVLYQDAALVPGANMPQLRLDLHVYAAKPQDRFALINMHKMHEGDSLQGGVRVEAITPDGVVMSHNGSKFLLPRE